MFDVNADAFTVTLLLIAIVGAVFLVFNFLQ